MATIQNPAQQNEDLANPGNPVNQTGPTAGTSGGVGTSQGGATGSGSAGPNQSPVSPVANSPNGQNPSGYTDVATYLNANQNNQAANNLGGQVAGNLTNSYNSTIGDINNSATQQQNSINSGYTPDNSQLISQVAANPTAAVSNPNEVSQFQGLLNDQYTGPTSWADTTNASNTTTPGYGTLQGEVNTAQQNSNINLPGMANVLTQQVEQQLNPGQVGEGINNLDTLLLTGNANNAAQVQAAAQPFAGLTNYLNTQNTNLGTDVTNAQANAAQAQQDALNAFTGSNGTLTNLNNTINTNAQNQLTAAQQEQQQLLTDLGNVYGGVTPTSPTQNLTVNTGALSPQDLAALGMTQDQWNALAGGLQNAGVTHYETGHNFGAASNTGEVNLDQFLQQQNPNTVINPGSVATPQQYQEMTAINQLLGAQAPVQTEAISPLNAASAGTAANPANLNTFDYNAAVQAEQNLAQQETQTAQQQANQETAAADLAHAQSQHGGPFSSLNNFLDTAGQYAANPLTVVPQEINMAKSKV